MFGGRALVYEPKLSQLQHILTPLKCLVRGYLAIVANRQRRDPVGSSSAPLGRVYHIHQVSNIPSLDISSGAL
jgi:hypothetical protein